MRTTQAAKDVRTAAFDNEDNGFLLSLATIATFARFYAPAQHRRIHQHRPYLGAALVLTGLPPAKVVQSLQTYARLSIEMILVN